jgi:GT2 family glycosyltransferase
MISSIVAVHNQLAMNQLFWQHLRANTQGEWELIVIDNGSTDGSGDFFSEQGAQVITNNGNYSYPYCQNLGIHAAQGEYLAFLNNDVIVPFEWNTRLIASQQHHGLDVVTSCGIERIESIAATRRLRRRWRWIKNLVLLAAGRGPRALALMHRWMYPDWVRFSKHRAREFALQVRPGIVGNTVLMTRRAIDLVGAWDERIQAADFDLYLRVAQLHAEHGDIQPVHIALDVFVHHYIRLTEGVAYPPFVDRDRLIRLEDKWTSLEIKALSVIDKE